MNARPLISLLHPTARLLPSPQFPRGWREAHDAWLERADHPEQVEYLLAVHESRWSDAPFFPVVVPDAPMWFDFSCIENRGRDCVVDQTNRAAAASRGLVLMGVQDDYFPPEHWDTLMLEALGPDLEQEKLVLCSTGASAERDRQLMIGGACTRALVERRGYALDPEFESMFADNWWAHENRADQAAGRLRIIERLDIVFEHRHPIFGLGKEDDIYRLQNREVAYRQGFATFQKKLNGTQVLAVCCPGEQFRAEWVWSTFDLMMQLETSGRFIVARHGGYTSNVYCTRMELTGAVLDLVPKADLVLWLDDDNVLTLPQFEMLLEDLVMNPGLDLVTGWCWCDHDGQPGPDGKMKPWCMSVGRQAEDLSCLKLTVEDWRRATETGRMLITSDDLAPHAFWSGFPVVLMRAEALRRMGPAAFVPIVRPDVHFGFTSEDTSFFVNAAAAGVKCAVDLRVKVPHYKMRAIEPYAFLPVAEREASPLQAVGAD